MSIEKFDAVLEEFNAAMAEAETTKEQDSIAKKFEKKIEKAEQELEAAFEAEIKAADAELLKEQKAAEPNDDLEDEFEPDAGEPMRSDALKMGKLDFAKKYKVKDIRVLAKAMGLKTGGKEADLVDRIYEALEKVDLK